MHEVTSLSERIVDITGGNEVVTDRLENKWMERGKNSILGGNIYHRELTGYIEDVEKKKINRAYQTFVFDHIDRGHGRGHVLVLNRSKHYLFQLEIVPLRQVVIGPMKRLLFALKETAVVVEKTKDKSLRHQLNSS
mmetsp:Transcript_8266/g.12003  ORF Transcript_8266/g.12003 Transcript_8266/m.12003 type:complete len:136 (-) Transcript_8266:1395-1802(-)